MVGRSRRDGKDGAYVIDLYVSGAYMTRMTTLQTVVELPEFQRRAKAIMSDDERKIRIPREGGGKSGGYRTIYVLGGRHMPIYLITVFAKNEKDNLTRAEQAAAVELSKALIAAYGDR